MRARHPDTQTWEPLQRLWSVAWPFVSVGMLVLAAVLPQGAEIGPVRLGAFLPLMGVLYWSLNGGLPTALVLAFVGGLAVDAAAEGPLGYWAVIFLVTVELGAAMADYSQRSWVAHGIIAVICLIAATAVEGVLFIASAHALPDVRDLMWRCLVGCLAYPLVAVPIYLASAPRRARVIDYAVGQR